MFPSFSLENSFFLAMLIGVTIAFLWVVQDFLQPVFWAALLASLFYPVHRRLLGMMPERTSLSALLVLLLILVIVILPLLFIGFAVTRESVALYQRVASGEIDVHKPLAWSAQALPMVNRLFDRAGVAPDQITEWLSDAAATVSRFLASRALVFGQNTLTFAVQFFLMLYLVFFFIRDGAHLLDRLIAVLPLGDARERRLFRKFAEVSRATIKGHVVVGIVQGSLGGITFALLGFNGAVFWAVMMTVLSVFPAVGASLVWIPAAVWLFATGSTAKAVILVLVGVFVIGLVDNLLRPLLVGRDTKMPDYLILLSTLGGITAMGISGFVIGPIIAALFLVAWDMFAEDFSEPVNGADS